MRRGRCGGSGTSGAAEALPKPTVTALPEVMLGYILSAGATQLAPRIAGPGPAAQLIFSGPPPAFRVSRLRGLHSQAQTRGCINFPASP